MNTPVSNPVQTTQQHPSWFERRHSGSNFLFALGVVMMCFGEAITGHHEVTMIGLALIVFTSMFKW